MYTSCFAHCLHHTVASNFNKDVIKKLLRIIVVIIIISAAQVSHAQNTGKPRLLVTKGAYTHVPTEKKFPDRINAYKRTGIYSFDRQKTNIGATYKSQEDKCLITIYIYPAGEGSEDRLRNEYLSSLKEIAVGSKRGVTATQAHAFLKKDDYKVNGFKAAVLDVKEHTRTYLSVYECGKWFFKFRITSELLDSTGVSHLERKILDEFAPTDFVKKEPLSSEATIYFAPAARVDSLIAVSALGSALKKVRWAQDNVDSLERAAGFPGLYLELHVESLQEFARQEYVKHEIRKGWARQAATTEYLSELNLIIESGYLREFIMDQYSSVMIVPDDVKLDFEAYLQWKLSNPISLDLNKRFYVVSYTDK